MEKKLKKITNELHQDESFISQCDNACTHIMPILNSLQIRFQTKCGKVDILDKDNNKLHHFHHSLFGNYGHVWFIIEIQSSWYIFDPTIFFQQDFKRINKFLFQSISNPNQTTLKIEDRHFKITYHDISSFNDSPVQDSQVFINNKGLKDFLTIL